MNTQNAKILSTLTEFIRYKEENAFYNYEL